MLRISMMAWRIGDILDIDRQIDWIEANGFDSISFHASSGTPGVWQGIPLAEKSQKELADIRRRLEKFNGIEVHAPFAYALRQPDTGSFSLLKQVCLASAAIGADVVTVHSQQPAAKDLARRDEWRKQIETLSELLAGSKTCVGLELTGDFDIFDTVAADNVGITLDVGHMYQRDVNGQLPLSLADHDRLGPTVQTIKQRLIHLHMHDYNSVHDHIEMGTGLIDFADFFAAIRAIHYKGMFCLELNPDRVSPEGILRSRNYMLQGMAGCAG